MGVLVGWPEIIGEALPPRRPDEPVSLRRDITDELVDHLACAMRRELLRAEDESAAHRAVLERFGDPQKLARQLWWQAMKEKIMKERIMLVSVVLLTIVCIAMAGFAWLAMSEGRQVNEAILEKLASLQSAQPTGAQPSDWARVTFRLVEEGEEVTPAAGVEVSIEGYAFGPPNTNKLYETANEDGVVTFGPIRPGKYNYRIYAHPAAHVSSLRGFTLYPSEDKEIRFVCPKRVPKTNITFAVNWPHDLKERDLLLDCVIEREHEQCRVGGRLWSTQWPYPP